MSSIHAHTHTHTLIPSNIDLSLTCTISRRIYVNHQSSATMEMMGRNDPTCMIRCPRFSLEIIRFNTPKPSPSSFGTSAL